MISEARRRLELLKGFTILDATQRVEELTTAYIASLQLPERAIADAAHLAFASAHGVDYLLTWNCAHIASAVVRRRVRALNEKLGAVTPVICTPEELLSTDVPE